MSQVVVVCTECDHVQDVDIPVDQMYQEAEPEYSHEHLESEGPPELHVRVEITGHGWRRVSWFDGAEVVTCENCGSNFQVLDGMRL